VGATYYGAAANAIIAAANGEEVDENAKKYFTETTNAIIEALGNISGNAGGVIGDVEISGMTASEIKNILNG